MAQLSGNKIKDSFLGLLKTNNNAAITGQIGITDGAGNSAGLALNPANSELQVNGTGVANPRLTLKDGKAGNDSVFVPFEARDSANALRAQVNFDQYSSFNLIAGQLGQFNDPELIVSNLGKTNAPAKIAVQQTSQGTAYLSPNNSDNWFTAYNERITAGSFDGGTSNLTLTKPDGTDIVVNIPSGGGAGVDSLNTLTGGLTLSAGTGISISDNGSDTITVTATGGGGGGTLQAQSIQTLPPIKGSVAAGNSYRTGLPVVNYNLNTMSSASSGNRCYWSIMPLGEGQTLSKIQFFVRSGLASATSNASIGIYSLTTDSAGELILGDLLRTVSTAIDVTTDGGKNVDFSSNPFTMPSGQTYGAVGIMLGINDTAEAFTAAGWNDSVFDSVWSNGTSSINGTLVSRVLATYYDAWNGTLPTTASTTAYASQTYYPLALLAQ